MDTLVIILAGFIAVILTGILCHIHLAHLIDKNVRPLTGAESLWVRRQLPIRTSPCERTYPGDMLRELQMEEEARNQRALSTSCVTPKGDVVEEKP